VSIRLLGEAVCFDLRRRKVLLQRVARFERKIAMPLLRVNVIFRFLTANLLRDTNANVTVEVMHLQEQFVATVARSENFLRVRWWLKDALRVLLRCHGL